MGTKPRTGDPGSAYSIFRPSITFRSGREPFSAKRLRRGALREIDPERSVAQYRLLHEMLTGAGFEHYEISNFARTGFRSQHNGNYWNGTRYLGVGPSAHSFDGALRQWNAADVRLYLERESRQEHFESETLSEHAAYNEFVMTSLRTASGSTPTCWNADSGHGNCIISRGWPLNFWPKGRWYARAPRIAFRLNTI